MAEDRSSQAGALVLATTSSDAIRFKCDFCNVTFNSDLDVSRHLSSPLHASNRNTFMSLQNIRDKDLEKQVPKNLGQILQLLKLRSVKDLRDLADKGYFELQKESLAGIADEFAKVLVKSLVEFEARNLPNNIRNAIMSALKDSDKNNVGQKISDSSGSDLSKSNKPSETRAATKAQPSTQNNGVPQVKREMAQQQQRHEPEQQTPFTPPPVQVRSAPVQVSQPQARPKPTVPARAAPQQSSSTPNSSQQQVQRNAPPPVQAIITTPTSTQTHPSQARGLPISNQAPRQAAPTQIKAPTSQSQTRPSGGQGSSTRTPPAQPRARLAAAQSSTAQTAPAQPSQPSQPRLRPPASQNLGTRTPSAQPQLNVSKTPNVVPESSSNTVEPRPRGPRLDSNYIPKLTIIKIEPKDN